MESKADPLRARRGQQHALMACLSLSGAEKAAQMWAIQRSFRCDSQDSPGHLCN